MIHYDTPRHSIHYDTPRHTNTTFHDTVTDVLCPSSVSLWKSASIHTCSDGRPLTHPENLPSYLLLPSSLLPPPCISLPLPFPPPPSVPPSPVLPPFFPLSLPIFVPPCFPPSLFDTAPPYHVTILSIFRISTPPPHHLMILRGSGEGKGGQTIPGPKNCNNY